jgi:hypothetical protein
MRAYRSQFRFATWFALAALAFQLVLSFGHIHPRDLLAGGYARAPATVNVAGLRLPGSDLPAQPAERDDLCTVCASMSLAGSLLIPAAPTLAVATAAPHIWRVDRITILGPKLWRGPHQARGPPPA